MQEERGKELNDFLTGHHSKNPTFIYYGRDAKNGPSGGGQLGFGFWHNSKFKSRNRVMNSTPVSEICNDTIL